MDFGDTIRHLEKTKATISKEQTTCLGIILDQDSLVAVAAVFWAQVNDAFVLDRAPVDCCSSDTMVDNWRSSQ